MRSPAGPPRSAPVATPEADSLRVVILIPVLLRGGTEAQTLHLVRALRDAGHAVTVACYFESDPDVCREFAAAGTDVRLLGLGASRDAGRAGRLLAAGLAVRSLLREIRPDVAHVQYLAPGLVPILAARAAGVPVVLATVHRSAAAHGWRARAMLRIAARFCRCVVCVSRAVEAGWFGDAAVFEPETPLTRRRHVTVYNGVDCGPLSSEAAARRGDRLAREMGMGGRPVVTVVGRLRREKGQRTLIEAMGLLAHRVPGARLLVVGDGPDRLELQRLAEDLGVSDSITWAGSRPPDELPAIYALSRVVAVPSLFEGFGLVAVEAMAAGRPVVASAVGGLPEIVDDGRTGLLVPPADPAALGAALARLLGDPGEARLMGRAGRVRAQQLFSRERFEHSTLALYETVRRGSQRQGQTT